MPKPEIAIIVRRHSEELDDLTILAGGDVIAVGRIGRGDDWTPRAIKATAETCGADVAFDDRRAHAHRSTSATPHFDTTLVRKRAEDLSEQVELVTDLIGQMAAEIDGANFERKRLETESQTLREALAKAYGIDCPTPPLWRRLAIAHAQNDTKGEQAAAWGLRALGVNPVTGEAISDDEIARAKRVLLQLYPSDDDNECD